MADVSRRRKRCRTRIARGETFHNHANGRFHSGHAAAGARWNSVAPTARLAPDAFSQVLPQNRNRVHLQSAKDQRPDGFSDVVLIEAYSPIRKLYEAGEKTQNL
jgi:hypothetical protein